MNNNNNLKDFLKKNGFSVAICSTIAILLVATLYFSYTGFQSSEPNNMVKNDEKNSFEAVNKSDVKSYKESTTQKETEKTTDKKQSEKISETTTETTTNSKQSKEENKQDNSNEKTNNIEKENKENKSSEEAITSVPSGEEIHIESFVLYNSNVLSYIAVSVL